MIKNEVKRFIEAWKKLPPKQQLYFAYMVMGAALIYGCNGDTRKCIYWIAAAVLNVAVKF